MPRRPTGLKKYNFYLEDQVVTALDWVAERRGTTRSELVRQAIRDYAVENLKIEKGVAEVLDVHLAET